MPLPRTSDVGQIMHFLKGEDGHKWSRKQMVAIALRHARKMGAKIPKPRKK